MNYRFFIAPDGSATYAAFIADGKLRDAAAAAIRVFMAKYGATQCYGTRPSNYCFDFEDKPDLTLWKRLDRGYHYVPRSRDKVAAELRADLKALPIAPGLHECLGVDFAGQDFLVEDMRMYRPRIRFYSRVKPKLLIVAMFRT